MRKKIVIFLTVLVLAALLSSVAFAGGNAKVVYTWIVNDLGQGVWGGGPLFDDGTAGGNFPLSITIPGEGQLIAHFHPVSWEEVVPGESVDICFEVHVIKGDSGAFPPEFCIADVLFPLPVNGPGQLLILDPHPDPEIPHPLLIRVTPAN